MMLHRVPPFENVILGFRLVNLQGTNIAKEDPDANNLVGLMGKLDNFKWEGFSSFCTFFIPIGPFPQTNTLPSFVRPMVLLKDVFSLSNLFKSRPSLSWWISTGVFTNCLLFPVSLLLCTPSKTPCSPESTFRKFPTGLCPIRSRRPSRFDLRKRCAFGKSKWF